MSRSLLQSDPPEMVFHYGNDQLLQLLDLTDKLTELAVTTATVTAVIKDEDDNPISGIPNPLTLTHAGSGIYRGIVPDDATLSHGQRIIVEITADDGTDRKGFWKRGGVVLFA